VKRLGLVVGAGLLAAAKPITYTLPPERQIELPPGPDVQLVRAQCSACHSLDYIQTQPRGKGEQFWRDSVTKMTSVYGAAFSPEDANRIVAYLARTYGTSP
jgi:predicted secreted protein